MEPIVVKLKALKGLQSFNHPNIVPHWQNGLAKASSCSDRQVTRSKRRGEVEGGRESNLKVNFPC